MLIALLMSLITIAAGRLGYTILRRDALEFLALIDFRHTLLNGMLAFLLFAGSQACRTGGAEPRESDHLGVVNHRSGDFDGSRRCRSVDDWTSFGLSTQLRGKVHRQRTRLGQSMSVF
jgi:hypothetical protein